jgi:four helix bundle protein
MTFAEWEAGAAGILAVDTIWRMRVYRLAAYIGEVGGADARALARHRFTRRVAEQLFEAVGSIHAHIAEGYSRSGGRDRVKFYEYGLGSARESRGWYLHCRVEMGADLVRARIDVLEEIIRQLLAIIPRERGRPITRMRVP